MKNYLRMSKLESLAQAALARGVAEGERRARETFEADVAPDAEADALWNEVLDRVAATMFAPAPPAPAPAGAAAAPPLAPAAPPAPAPAPAAAPPPPAPAPTA